MKKVAVGISGGIDSATVAYLLKNEGYEVIGVTMLLFDNASISDAKTICDRLNIKHIILDLRKEFKEMVIDEFIKQSSNGLTPNPCVICNRYFKFGLMYEKMLELDVDYVATGHYVKNMQGVLYKGADQNKDQSYFLAQIKKDILKRVLFPLGNYKKEEIREIAKQNNLIIKDKKESTGACFIGEGFYKKFIKDNFENREGDIVDITSNKVIGKHNGLMYYTIGQRKGLNIGGFQDRLFVVGKNVKSNTLYVALSGENDYLYSNSAVLEYVNFISDTREEITLKFRYKSNEVKGTIKKIGEDFIVEYDKTKSVTPGQLCVFYEKDKVIGSGFIKEVRNDGKKLWYLL